MQAEAQQRSEAYSASVVSLTSEREHLEAALAAALQERDNVQASKAAAEARVQSLAQEIADAKVGAFRIEKAPLA